MRADTPKFCGTPPIRKPGFEPRVLEYPREHRARRRLAVRAATASTQRPLQHVLAQPLRAGDVRQPAVEDRFHQRIAARDDVADHVDVGFELHLIGAVAFDELDPLRLELRAHRRIDVRVAAGDLVARRACETREAAHERAADAENVEVHGSTIGGTDAACRERSPEYTVPVGGEARAERRLTRLA